MHAAVVRSFDVPPRYEMFQTPEPSGEHEIAVDVLAAGLHPRVRSGAAGRHYTSTDALPLIPGVDGVGRSEDGQLLYFAASDGAFGTMAERTVIDRRRALVLEKSCITHPNSTHPNSVVIRRCRLAGLFIQSNPLINC